jgi:hypothetical protein
MLSGNGVATLVVARGGETTRHRAACARIGRRSRERSLPPRKTNHHPAPDLRSRISGVRVAGARDSGTAAGDCVCATCALRTEYIIRPVASKTAFRSNRLAALAKPLPHRANLGSTLISRSILSPNTPFSEWRNEARERNRDFVGIGKVGGPKRNFRYTTALSQSVGFVWWFLYSQG